MLTNDTNILAAYKELYREVSGGVKIYDETGATVSQELLPTGSLVSFTIDKTAPNGKFFGFAVTQKLQIEILGKLPLAKGTKLAPYLHTKETESPTLPFFYVEEAAVNEVKNTTSITAYDIMQNTHDREWVEPEGWTYPVRMDDFAIEIARQMGATITQQRIASNLSTTVDEKPAFPDGMTLAALLVYLAEVTATVVYCDTENNIRFRVCMGRESLDSLTGTEYFDLTTKDTVNLTQIIAATELEDNIQVGEEGRAQVIRENPFLAHVTRLEHLQKFVTLGYIPCAATPFNLVWRGNPWYEFGDTITVTTRTGEVKQVIIFNETLQYSGGLRSTCKWEDGAGESLHSNKIGEVVNKTFAKVDKVNRRIDMMAADIEENTGAISRLEIETDSISATVTVMEDATYNAIESVIKKVNATMTEDEVKLLIATERDAGATKVVTDTGFTFNDAGLTVSKSGSEMSTIVSEDGMTVYRNNEEVLVADNVGVNAQNLRATTYLIIGQHSRFQDYDDPGENKYRTGCFWIGNVF